MRDGYKVFDCDMHVHEPCDLWLNYIDDEYKDRCLVGSIGLARVTSNSPLITRIPIASIPTRSSAF